MTLLDFSSAKVYNFDFFSFYEACAMTRKYLYIAFSALAISLVVILINYKSSGDEAKEYYPSGKLRQEYTLRDGLINGLVKEYYESGGLLSEIEFSSGLQSGVGIFYYESGEVEQKVKYYKGLISDTAKFYYKSGAIREVSFFVHGKREGTVLNYFQNGNLKMTGKYRNGRKMEDWLFYDSLGKQNRTVFYSNDTIQSIIENSNYRNLLDGYTIQLPADVHKIKEFSRGAIFTGTYEGFGVVTFSMASKPFVIYSLSKEVDRELETAKHTVSELALVSKRTLDDRILIECHGQHKEERNSKKFDAIFLFANASDRFLIISAYFPPNSEGKIADVRAQIDSAFKSLKLEAPERIVE